MPMSIDPAIAEAAAKALKALGLEHTFHVVRAHRDSEGCCVAVQGSGRRTAICINWDGQDLATAVELLHARMRKTLLDS
jgi:hypothetical protein